jgi:methionyl-tRNA synthetase
MINQYRGGILPASEGDGQIAETARQTVQSFLECFERFEFARGLEAVWQLISAVDRHIVDRAPWKLAKSDNPADADLLDRTLYSSAEVLRIVCGLLSPVMPESIAKIWTQLGFDTDIQSVRVSDLHFGHLPSGQKLREVGAAFPRIEAKPAIEKMRELEEKERARQDALLGKPPAAAAATAAPAESGPATPTITIDDFVKVDLRVGLVKSAEAVKGADKLLHLKIDIGEPELRTIVAGIAKAYQPEALVGRKVVIVANLAPRKLRGIESKGMIVAASLEGGSPVLAGFLEDVPIGARLK